MSKWKKDPQLLEAKKNARVVHIRRHNSEQKTIRVVGTIAVIKLPDGRFVTGEGWAGSSAGSRLVGREVATGRAMKNAAIMMGAAVGINFAPGRIFEKEINLVNYIRELKGLPPKE